MSRAVHALLVDPNDDDRTALKSIITEADLGSFTFTEARDGADAFARFDVKGTDLVFLDSSMPDQSGAAFIRALRSKWNYFGPAIMVTGEKRAARVREAIEQVGVDGYVLKPIHVDRFVEGLRQVVDTLPETSGTACIPHQQVVPESARTILSTACSLETVLLEEDPDVRSGDVIFGLVSMLGSVNWTCALGLSRESSQGIVKAFAGFEIDFSQPDMGDAVGELTNLFAGQIKRSLAAHKETVEISLPSVVRAKGLSVLVRSRTAVSNHFLRCEAGDLWTGLTIGRNVGFVL